MGHCGDAIDDCDRQHRVVQPIAQHPKQWRISGKRVLCCGMHRGIFAKIAKHLKVLVGFNGLKLQFLKPFADFYGLFRRYKIKIRPKRCFKTDIEEDPIAPERDKPGHIIQHCRIIIFENRFQGLFIPKKKFSVDRD